MRKDIIKIVNTRWNEIPNSTSNARNGLFLQKIQTKFRLKL